jgi:hypothetical protein
MIEDLRHLPGSCFDVYVIRIVSEPQNESLTCQTEDFRVWRPGPCATARTHLAKADTAFQGASVGQPTELCLETHNAALAEYIGRAALG